MTTSATVGGSWTTTGSGSSTLFTFTPTADNANINVVDIQNRLQGSVTPGFGSVRIVTTNGSGTQVGNVNFVVGLSAQNGSTSRYSLQVVSGGDIVVSSSMSLLGGDWSLSSNYGYDIDFSALGTGNIVLNGSITTSGQSVGACCGSVVRSNGGNVVINASGYVKVGGGITASGGTNSAGSTSSMGGSVSITGAGGVTLTGGINTFGNLASGLITINSGNGTVTTGGGSGVNDGQVSGVISGGNFVKSGAGVFVIKGSNTYSSNTTISGGTLRLGSGSSIPSGTNLTVTGTLDLGGFSQTVRTLSGSGLITSSGSGALVLTVSDSGEGTTYSGVIENGTASSVGLTKTGVGTLVLSGTSSYTGPTLVSQGVLTVGHSNGLGISSQTTVSSGAVLQLQGGISVGALPLSLTGTGVSSGGALRNISGTNSWAGTVTLVSATTRINSDSGATLTLGGSSSISSNNISLQVGGSGNVVVSGVMSLGTGTMTKDGVGRLTLAGVNVYSGATSVNNGTLRLTNNNGLGSSSMTTVSSGATVELLGGVSVGNALSLTGAGMSNVGALRSVSGNNSWTGSIGLGSVSTYISSDADVLDIVGVMSGTSQGVRYGGLGTVEVSGSSTYTGVSEISAGATLLLGNNNVLSSSSNVLFSGGKLSSDGKNLSVGTLSVSSASELVLGTGAHTVRFSAGGTFGFTRLIIRGWEGVYSGSGSSGTAGQVFVGNGTVLTREQLDQIQFVDANNVSYYALQLGTGEVVPGLGRLSNPTGNSNVQVTSNPTSGGTWTVSGSGASTLFTFTPTADNANINVV
ncbi:MAG: beta strand repeat-containing protein, partial [Algoriphagus sp.]